MFLTITVIGIIFFALAIIIILLQLCSKKKLENNKEIENNNKEIEKFYEFKLQIRLISFTLLLGVAIIGYLGWNVKIQAVKELKTEIFKEFDSVLNFYVAEDSISISTNDTLKINFSKLRRTNSEKLPKFYKAPLIIVTAENAVFGIIKICKDYVIIRLIPEGKYKSNEMGPYNYNGKITLWFVEK